jgi:hypothetical protein
MLNATPVEASVVINGAYRGSTPLTLEGIEPGTYTVTFSHYGYRKFSTPVKVESGKISEVTATLVPETGSLAVNTSPAGARLALDSVDAGISPVTLTDLTVGNHTLVIKKEGFAPAVQPVRVIADQIIATDVVLAPISSSPTLPAGERGIIPVLLIACGAWGALFIFNRSRSR